MTWLVLRLHRVLVALLVPREIRRRVGADLRHTFELALRDGRRRGRTGSLLWRELGDLIVTAVTTRGGRRSGTSNEWEAGMGREKRGLLRTLTDDLRHAARSLRRSPAQVVFIVGTLALAVGAATTVYSAARATVLQPYPYDNADRMVGLMRTVGEFGRVGPDAEIAERWTAEQDIFESAILYGTSQKTLTGAGEAQVLTGLQVGADYFSVLGVAPVLGRAFDEEEVARGDRVALLGYELWKRRFGGDRSVLGRTLRLDGEVWTIVGVGPSNAPPPLSFVDRADLWLPVEQDEVTTAVAFLAPGVTVEEARERIDAIVEREHAEGLLSPQFRGTVALAAELDSSALQSALEILAVAVGFLLLIACLNVGGLLINRADRRQPETAVRIALGIGRGRLFRQHLLESVVLAGLAALAGTGVARLGLEVVRSFRPARLTSLDWMTLDGSALAFSVAAAIGTGLLFGLMPGITALSRQALDVLRTGVTGSENRQTARGRWTLVVTEIALSFAMLAGAGLLIQTVRSLSQLDPGFRTEGLVVTEIDLPTWKFSEGEHAALWDRLDAAAEAVPGVEAASLTSGVPTSAGVFFGQLELDGYEVPEARRREPFFGSSVDDDYFEVLGQRIVAGRGFTEDDLRSDEKVYVVGESTARDLFGDAQAVGAGLKLGGDEFGRVVGVVADVAGNSPGSERGLDRQMYTPGRYSSRSNWGEHMLAVRTARPAAQTLTAIRQALLGVEPDLVIEGRSIEAYLADTFSTQRFTLTLLIALAAVASLLACLGLYGVVSQIVGRRTREIGIRMSLGADRGMIARMVLRSGLVAAAAGIAIGVIAATFGGRVLESQLYGVEPTDPVPLVGAAVVLALAALLATWLPARRAARTDPVRAIAAE